MEKLHAYLKSLNKEEREAYAKACGTTVQYLFKAVYKNHKKFDGALCLLLEQNSGGKVLKAELRPDIWPELVRDKAA